LYDSRQKRLLLARDHVGVKPLFYAITDSHLVFGSEIKVLLASGLIPRELDLTALGEFLAWEYVPGSGTLIKAVRKLEAAHTLELRLNGGNEPPTIELQRFWDVPKPSPDPVRLSREAWADTVDDTIRRCVQRQLVSDVPLGAFLSGGVDSSLVVAAMGDAQTYSIGFDDPTYNELAWAQRVAEHLGVSHDFEVIKPSVVDLFDGLMNFMDDPIGDFSIFPTYLVSRHARRHVTVALSGDGGDELFGGYETYLAQEKARVWQRLPRFLRAGVAEPVIHALRPTQKKKGLINKAKRFVEGLEHPNALGHARWRLFVGESLRRSLFTQEARSGMVTGSDRHILALQEDAADRDELDRGLYVDLRSYLVDNCLVKVDRMSMACSLETRVPLLDKELVELAFRVPSDLKIHRGQTKDLLKRVAARHVPRDCVYRPKEGFSIPIKHWLRTEFRPAMEELLSPSRIACEGVFDTETVSRLKTEHLSGQENHSHVLWSMLVFQDWRSRWGV
jgi:asparagine synthase (glutamine-hydrolysing)